MINQKWGEVDNYECKDWKTIVELSSDGVRKSGVWGWVESNSGVKRGKVDRDKEPPSEGGHMEGQSRVRVERSRVRLNEV